MRARYCKCDNAFCDWPDCNRQLTVRARETTDASGEVECSALCKLTGYIREHIAPSEIMQSKAAKAKATGKRGGTRKYSDKDEQTIIDFVERPEYELDRTREGTRCYNITGAVLDWSREKHKKNLPKTQEEFRKAYENIKRRRRSSGR